MYQKFILLILGDCVSSVDKSSVWFPDDQLAKLLKPLLFFGARLPATNEITQGPTIPTWR